MEGVGVLDGDGLGVSEGKFIVGSPLFGRQHRSGSAKESRILIFISSLIGNISVPLSLIILNSPIKLPVFFVSFSVN